jgi:hypothetical protein
MGSVVEKVTKPIRKIIPKEIRPVLPIAAAFLPVPGMGAIGSALAKTQLNPLVQAAIKRGIVSAGVQGVTEGKVDPFKTAVAGLAGGLSEVGPEGLPQFMQRGELIPKLTEAGEVVEPSLLQKGVGALQTGAEKVAGFAAEKPFQTATAASGIIASKEAYDAAQAALDEYNQSLGESGIEDIGERRDLIRRYMANAGFDESQTNDALARYGYLANGGRVGYEMGGSVEKTPNEIFIEMYQQGKYDTLRGAVEDANRYQRGETTNYEKLTGRKPFQEGGDVSYTDLGRSGVIYRDPQGNPISKEEFLKMTDEEEGIPSIRMKDKEDNDDYKEPKTLEDLLEDPELIKQMLRQGMKDGGIMNLKGKEMDLRGGGFVPIGKKEKADDVPARLSKNEFVFTADAVKGAGDGDINKGVKKMYNTMRMLEGKLA